MFKAFATKYASKVKSSTGKFDTDTFKSGRAIYKTNSDGSADKLMGLGARKLPIQRKK